VARPSQYVCVETGDSLWTIAQEVLGDGLRWREVAHKNRIHHPYKVSEGQCLEVPQTL